MLAEGARLKRLLRRRQAQRQHVPADHLRARRQRHVDLAQRVATAVGQRFHRQPFQACAGCQLKPDALQRGGTVTAVETRRTGCGDERMAACRQCGVQVQFITTHHAARRVQHDVVADGRAFGVQALQHAQRAFVAVMRHGAFALAAVVQRELGFPAQRHALMRNFSCAMPSLIGPHRPAQKARCTAAISSSTAGTGPVTAMAFWPRAKTSRQGKSSVGFSAWLPVSCKSRLSLMP